MSYLGPIIAIVCLYGLPRQAAALQLPCPWAARGLGGRFQMWRGAGEGPSAIGTVLGKDPEFAAVPWGSSRTPPRIPSNSPSDPPALNRRHLLVIWRILPWDPRLPVAIPGELEGIPGEVSGWNGSELSSERIHVRFSRNRRWNSGGWHRPGKAESGGFSRCRGPPGFFRASWGNFRHRLPDLQV